MQTGEATIKGVRGGHAYFAEVAVSLDTASGSTGVEVACTGKGFTSQGYSEDALAVGYDTWKTAARRGVTFAVQVADVRGVATIHRITGFTSDTNMTTIAVAAAHALWKAAGFVPHADTTELLQSKLISSLGRDWDQQPDL